MTRTYEERTQAFGHAIAVFLGMAEPPKRWPSIVEAVKHMEATGDWGRPVGDVLGGWKRVMNGALYRRDIDIGFVSDALWYTSTLIGEWETKPAEKR